MERVVQMDSKMKAAPGCDLVEMVIDLQIVDPATKDILIETHEDLDITNSDLHQEASSKSSPESFESCAGTERTVYMTASGHMGVAEMAKVLECFAMVAEKEHHNGDSFVASCSSSSATQSSTWCNVNFEVDTEQGDCNPDFGPNLEKFDHSDLTKVRMIGRGASSKVYAAKLDCIFPLAVKMFNSSYSGECISLIRRELDILVKLEHPNTMRLIGYSVDSQGRVSIVMELMDCSLRALIESRMRERKMVGKNENGVSPAIVPFIFSESVDIMREIAKGMRYLHSEEVMHRDLKSDNVLVHWFDNGKMEVADVMIVDFGLSLCEKLGVPSKAGGSYIGAGTGFWRAPEILPTTTADRSRKADLKAIDCIVLG